MRTTSMRAMGRRAIAAASVAMIPTIPASSRQDAQPAMREPIMLSTEYLIRFPPLDVGRSGVYEHRFTSHVTTEMHFRLEHDDAQVRRVAFAAGTNVRAVLLRRSDRNLLLDGAGVLDHNRDSTLPGEWVRTTGGWSAFAYWKQGAADADLERGVEYILRLSVDVATPSDAPGIVSPSLRGQEQAWQ